MKRPMTLTGFILATVSTAIYAGYSMFVLTLVIDILSSTSATGGATALALLILDLAIAVVTLVLNAVSIKAWNRGPEAYKKYKGKVIAATVFNFIMIVSLIVGIATTTAETFPILNIIIILALVAANVLAYVDLGLEGKRVAKLEAEGSMLEEDAQEATDVERKIEKLNSMKEQGLISDEEYEELKKSYINEKING